jgi:hypothetical protein
MKFMNYSIEDREFPARENFPIPIDLIVEVGNWRLLSYSS